MPAPFAVAVKALMIQDGKALIIRRRQFDSHKAGAWDLPGGRLEVGENPYDGLKREIKEETGMGADIICPLDVHHFVRDDQQTITMMIFLCTPHTTEIMLSEEHDDFKWVTLDDKAAFPDWIKQVVGMYEKHYRA